MSECLRRHAEKTFKETYNVKAWLYGLLQFILIQINGSFAIYYVKLHIDSLKFLDPSSKSFLLYSIMFVTVLCMLFWV